jgi:hypothetical protein
MEHGLAVTLGSEQEAISHLLRIYLQTTYVPGWTPMTQIC